MRLGELTQRLDLALSASWAEIEVAMVGDDSRRVVRGGLFAALPGPQKSGEEFIPQAVMNGARVVLVAQNADRDLETRFPGVCFLRVEEPLAAFRSIVDKFFGHPSDKVRVIGVTGTNGKTTITYLVEAILAAAGHRSGIVGTVNCRVGGRSIPSKNTTPGLVDNQAFLDELSRQGVSHAVMEVSSHALDQGRVDLIDFRGAVFTNLTGDHLDYHKTMEKYFEAKARLFTGLHGRAYAVLNQDDIYGQALLSRTPVRAITYGRRKAADVMATAESLGLEGTRFQVRAFGDEFPLRTPLIGVHNIYNILAAFAVGIGEGIAPDVIVRGVEALRHIPGRLERVPVGNGFHVFIDYAHTDDGLRNVLESLQVVKHKRIIVVFGCGGDRDRTKRPRMGKVASDLADLSILTSDNPRGEDPQAIVDEIIPGFDRASYDVILDRREAIARALDIAQEGDIVLLAGKGHETYQVFRDRTVDFVERDIVIGHLNGRGQKEGT